MQCLFISTKIANSFQYTKHLSLFYTVFHTFLGKVSFRNNIRALPVLLIAAKWEAQQCKIKLSKIEKYFRSIQRKNSWFSRIKICPDKQRKSAALRIVSHDGAVRA
ncbi:hypothetical protein HMPREF1870_00777 [Bacteroidales bacterium KA00344]|nr:hypothetical protein HMPREF1870_00777 [Bacteroidales bacterium KA00344]